MLIRSDSVSVIAIRRSDILAIICGNKLSALPAKRIITESARISDCVIRDRFAAVLCEQIAPIGVSVGIIYRFKSSSERACGEGITLLCRDIAGLFSAHGRACARRARRIVAFR